MDSSNNLIQQIYKKANLTTAKQSMDSCQADDSCKQYGSEGTVTSDCNTAASLENFNEHYFKVLAADYDDIELIGSGSFGQVVKATHRATGSLVAIKILKTMGRSSYQRRQLISEIQLMRKLTAMPNNVFTTKLFDIIVPDIDSTQADTLPMIMLVMDYIDSDLTRIMKNASNLDLQEAHVITIIYNILCSIKFLHSCNIMHRDLKPANILIDNKCVPIICDFGLARTSIKPSKSTQFQDVEKTTQSGR